MEENFDANFKEERVKAGFFELAKDCALIMRRRTFGIVLFEFGNIVSQEVFKGLGIFKELFIFNEKALHGRLGNDANQLRNCFQILN